MPAMRIAHVTATFPPYYSGTGMVCYHNALELARRGHDVTVFTAAHPPGHHEYPPEIRVVRLPPLFRIGNAPLLPGLLGLRGFDLIHLHLPFIFGAELVWAASKLHGVPYVVTYHNDIIGDGVRRYLFDVYLTISSPLVLGGARKLMAVTLDHAMASRQAVLFRQRESDVIEVPNGVDTEHFRPGVNGEPLRRRCSISNDELVVLFVGALDRAHHYRRVDVLMQAIQTIDDAHMHLVIAGDGDWKTKYQELAKTFGMDQRTHFLGWVAHHDLPAVYAASDVVVLPSQLQESFGMVLIEAMACGKPVIASDLPGVRTVVRNGETGWLCQPGNSDDLVDKIRCALGDSERQHTMGARGRAHVEAHYAWPKVIDRLEAVYASALSGRA